MIADLLTLALVLAESDGDSTWWLLLLGPLGGAGTYGVLWRYYRNTHQSHAFEHETKVVAQPVTGSDRKIDEVKGTKRTRINGDNHASHRTRVQRIP